MTTSRLIMSLVERRMPYLLADAPLGRSCPRKELSQSDQKPAHLPCSGFDTETGGRSRS